MIGRRDVEVRSDGLRAVDVVLILPNLQQEPRHSLDRGDELARRTSLDHDQLLKSEAEL